MGQKFDWCDLWLGVGSRCVNGQVGQKKENDDTYLSERRLSQDSLRGSGYDHSVIYDKDVGKFLTSDPTAVTSDPTAGTKSRGSTVE